MRAKMDLLNKLQKLQLEILDFGDVVSQTENPVDIDFINACELFSQHLNYQLKVINSSICMQDIRPKMQQTTAQLYQLSELITPAPFNQQSNYQWSNKLLDFCSQLQTLKNVAA